MPIVKISKKFLLAYIYVYTRSRTEVFLPFPKKAIAAVKYTLLL